MYRFPHSRLDTSRSNSDSVIVELGVPVGYHVGTNYETAICKLIRDTTVSESGKSTFGTHTTFGGDLYDYIVWTNQRCV